MNALAIAAALGLGYLLFGGEKKAKLPPGIPPGTPPPPPPVEPPPPGPPSLSDLDRAKQLAPAIESDIRANAKGYDKSRLREFQRLVRLGVDGLYGPRSAGALEWALGHTAPRALYMNTRTRSYTSIPYTPVSA